MLKQHIGYFIKGIIIGASMLLPGVSGGTMAILLNIYDELIVAVGSFLKNKRKSFFLLLVVAVGGILGAVLFANPILYLTNAFPKPMRFFFLGAILASFPMLIKKAELKKFRVKHCLYPLLGIASLAGIALMPADFFSSSMGIIEWALLFLAGFFCAVALVLPGISVSFVLLLFGLYEPVMQSIQQVDLLYLLPIGIGGMIGIIGTTKVLEKILKFYAQQTYLVIIGFLVGSVVDVFPGIPVKWEWFICMLTLTLGFGVITLFSYHVKKEK